MRSIDCWPSVGEGLPARRYGDSRCPLLVSPLLPPYWPCPLILRRLLRKPKGRKLIFVPQSQHLTDLNMHVRLVKHKQVQDSGFAAVHDQVSHRAH